MATLGAISDIGPQQFSNPESLCHSEAANQALAQSALRFGRRCHLKNFNLKCRNGMNLAVLHLHVSPMPPTKFQLSLTYHLGVDVVSRFSRWPL